MNSVFLTTINPFYSFSSEINEKGSMEKIKVEEGFFDDLSS